ncbi:DNA-binding transcriptional LysR family regulator [Pelomonas saccharophila]|uniref:DNA-binding transcriptional LysR family regulator n=1 Tax=Roseateles saccharophilus TaxID=304 RepID=A0ABU1YPX4_ROSSA|nr:hypothetical protein [Roseateles saccharophilus]MDR7270912.1 DNA-binding transcriptional LysR family regulator [Roseateles saccharophilus]
MLGSAKLRRRVGLLVPGYMAIPDVVAQTDLLGTVPRRLADACSAVLPLAMLPLPFAMPPLQVSLIWHRQQIVAAVAGLTQQVEGALHKREIRLK